MKIAHALPSTRVMGCLRRYMRGNGSVRCLPPCHTRRGLGLVS